MLGTGGPGPRFAAILERKTHDVRLFHTVKIFSALFVVVIVGHTEIPYKRYSTHNKASVAITYKRRHVKSGT